MRLIYMAGRVVRNDGRHGQVDNDNSTYPACLGSFLQRTAMTSNDLRLPETAHESINRMAN